MLTEKDYCDYDTCVALKELGFNEYCRGYFDPLCKIFNETSYLKGWNNIEGSDCGVLSCPSLYEAQKWLREEKHLFVEIQYRSYTWPYGYEIYNSERERLDVVDGYKTYEEALSEGIKEAVKILQND